jgi:hypothetical protein
MEKLKLKARNIFLDYILTEKPINGYTDYWKIYIVINDSVHYIHHNSMRAIEQLKSENFNGYIYYCFCIANPNLSIDITKIC